MKAEKEFVEKQNLAIEGQKAGKAQEIDEKQNLAIEDQKESKAEENNEKQNMAVEDQKDGKAEEKVEEQISEKEAERLWKIEQHKYECGEWMRRERLYGVWEPKPQTNTSRFAPIYEDEGLYVERSHLKYEHLKTNEKDTLHKKCLGIMKDIFKKSKNSLMDKVVKPLFKATTKKFKSFFGCFKKTIVKKEDENSDVEQARKTWFAHYICKLLNILQTVHKNKRNLFTVDGDKDEIQSLYRKMSKKFLKTYKKVESDRKEGKIVDSQLRMRKSIDLFWNEDVKHPLTGKSLNSSNVHDLIGLINRLIKEELGPFFEDKLIDDLITHVNKIKSYEFEFPKRKAWEEVVRFLPNCIEPINREVLIKLYETFRLLETEQNTNKNTRRYISYIIQHFALLKENKKYFKCKKQSRRKMKKVLQKLSEKLKFLENLAIELYETGVVEEAEIYLILYIDYMK